jgi:hypothetical protein
LPDFEEHLLQSGWGDGDEQSSGLVAFILEAMQTPHGHVKKRAFASDDAFFAQLKGHLSFEDEERLFLSAVDMWWRSATGRNDRLERGVLSVRFFTGGQESVNVADDGDTAAFV